MGNLLFSTPRDELYISDFNRMMEAKTESLCIFYYERYTPDTPADFFIGDESKFQRYHNQKTDRLDLFFTEESISLGEILNSKGCKFAIHSTSSQCFEGVLRVNGDVFQDIKIIQQGVVKNIVLRVKNDSEDGFSSGIINVFSKEKHTFILSFTVNNTVYTYETDELPFWNNDNIDYNGTYVYSPSSEV